MQIPEDAQTLTVSAAYTGAEGEIKGARLEGIMNLHPQQRHLHVTSSTQRATVGEYAVLHVRTNFPIKRFHYMVNTLNVIWNIYFVIELIHSIGVE